ncbi:MAG: MoaD/ThiS family protein [Bythopirellula sp.]
MRIRVKLFAGARELAGQQEVALELASTASVADLRTELQVQCPALRPLLQHTLFAINANYASDDTILSDGAEIACIPPVSGG